MNAARVSQMVLTRPWVGQHACAKANYCSMTMCGRMHWYMTATHGVWLVRAGANRST